MCKIYMCVTFYFNYIKLFILCSLVLYIHTYFFDYIQNLINIMIMIVEFMHPLIKYSQICTTCLLITINIFVKIYNMES